MLNVFDLNVVAPKVFFAARERLELWRRHSGRTLAWSSQGWGFESRYRRRHSPAPAVEKTAKLLMKRFFSDEYKFEPITAESLKSEKAFIKGPML
jgi:hypothetical protein